MKKNKALRIATALLVAVLVTTCGMTGALAKYVDSFTITSSTVRAGLFKVTGPASTYTTFDVQLLDGNKTNETNAQAYSALAANDNIIVPGSMVKVNGFKIVNLSEVDVDVTITGLTVTGFTGALRYSLNGTSGWTASPPAFTDLFGSATVRLDSFPKAAGGGTNEATLSDFYILWPFDNVPSGLDGQTSANTDTVDTGIGTGQADDLLTLANNGYADIQTSRIITVGATVNVTQVD